MRISKAPSGTSQLPRGLLVLAEQAHCCAIVVFTINNMQLVIFHHGLLLYSGAIKTSLKLLCRSGMLIHSSVPELAVEYLNIFALHCDHYPDFSTDCTGHDCAATYLCGGIIFLLFQGLFSAVCVPHQVRACVSSHFLSLSLFLSFSLLSSLFRSCRIPFIVVISIGGTKRFWERCWEAWRYCMLCVQKNLLSFRNVSLVLIPSSKCICLTHSSPLLLLWKVCWCTCIHFEEGISWATCPC